jgi:hypothetical protein
VSCLACLFTTDAISRERRKERSIAIPVARQGDVLLGSSRFLGFKGICMLAAFPMLMIPVLAGDVGW